MTKSEQLRDLSRHPTIVGICADLVGPDVHLYWDQAVYKKPEKPRRFPWHQDNGYAFVEPQQYLTVWLALTDATLDNGCPWVVPGLHRQGTLRHQFVDPLGFECLTDPDGAVAAEVPAGGAVVFSSLTPHLTGPNTTDAVRKAYILQYAPAGAEVLQGDPAAGPPTARVPADDPRRQYPVLRGSRLDHGFCAHHVRMRTSVRRTVGGQWPVKVALPGPLSRKECTPMLASSVVNTSAKSCCSRSRPPLSVMSRPRSMARLARP